MSASSSPEERAPAGLRDMVRRLPEWLRTDLSSTDPQRRERAEETLVAMIDASAEPKVPSRKRDRSSSGP